MRIPGPVAFAALGFLAVISVGCTSSRLPDAGDALAGAVPAQVSVCFVPAQHCDTAIIAAIASARRSIRVQAYGFTAQPILRALADAKARGVDVEAILDKSNDPPDRPSRRSATEPRARSPEARQTGAQFTTAAHIPTWIDYAVAIAHNKVIVIDGRLVIGGSYNYTTSAERRNAENVTFIESTDVARMYLANWGARRTAARPYIPASDNEARTATPSDS